MVNCFFVEGQDGKTYVFDCPYVMDYLKINLKLLKESGDYEIRSIVEPDIIFLTYCLCWLKKWILPLNEDIYKKEFSQIKTIRDDLINLYSKANEIAYKDLEDLCPAIKMNE